MTNVKTRAFGQKKASPLKFCVDAFSPILKRSREAMLECETGDLKSCFL